MAEAVAPRVRRPLRAWPRRGAALVRHGVEQLGPPRVVLALAIGVFAIVFGRLVVLRHERFGTFDFDLGIYDQAVWLLAHGHGFDTVRGLGVFGNHVNLAFYLLVPFYWLGAGPNFLNLVMVAAVAASAVPVFRLGRHWLTDEWHALVPALALALLVGLRGAPYGRRAMFALPVAWLLGSIVGLSAALASAGTLAASLWFVLLGGLVLADAKLSLRSVTALCAELAALKQQPHTAWLREMDSQALQQAIRDLDLAFLTARGVDAFVERRVGAFHRVGRHRAGYERGVEQVLCSEECIERERG